MSEIQLSLFFIIQVIWFHLPAGVANMVPVPIAKIFPDLDCPVDFGKSVRGIRIFGAHKTWRGLIAGFLASTFVFFLQRVLQQEYGFFRELSLLDYQGACLAWGTAMGLGALGGDLIKSFFKRRRGVEAGKSWPPFDQIDWIIGNLIISYPLMASYPTKGKILFALLSIPLGLFLSLAAKVVGFFIKLNDHPI